MAYAFSDGELLTAQKLNDRFEETDNRLAQSIAKVKMIEYEFTPGLSSNNSVTVTAQTDWGFTPDVVIAQITKNARLVVIVSEIAALTTKLEFFNPSPSNSSSSCLVTLIAIAKVNQ